MFLKLLKDSDDEVWDTYYVFEKDSPTDETLAQYKVVHVFLWLCMCGEGSYTQFSRPHSVQQSLQQLQIHCQHTMYDKRHFWIRLKTLQTFC